MLFPIVGLIIGLVALWAGSSLTISGCKRLAKKFNLSHALIGLTIISVGTSLPEIATNIFSGIKIKQGIPASGIAVGTNLGSDITQITFILGIVAILGVMYATKRTIYRDGAMILGSIIALFLAGVDGRISRWEGAVLIIGYLTYLVVVGVQEKAIKGINAELHNHKHKQISLFFNTLFIIVGLAVLIFATKLVVENALTIADQAGLAQSFIGVLIIGVGTALPEFSTALMGVFRKAEGISLGTLLGSNVTDPMLSTGIGASIAGFLMDKNLLFFDIPFWFIASIIALYLLRRKMRIGKEDRKEGLVLVCIFILFIFLKIKFFT